MPIAKFSARSLHPEVASAPLLLWGMSAGGEFNYEFTVWKPERVAAFIVNKGELLLHCARAGRRRLRCTRDALRGRQGFGVPHEHDRRLVRG